MKIKKKFILLKLWDILPFPLKKEFIFLCFLSLIAGVFEIVLLKYIGDFIFNISNPEIANITIFTPIFFLIIIFLGTIIRTKGIYLNTRYSAKIGSFLHKYILDKIINTIPRQQNSYSESELIVLLTRKIDDTVNYILLPLSCWVFSSSIIAVSIFIFLIFKITVPTIISSIFLSFTYLFFAINAKKKFKYNTNLISKNLATVVGFVKDTVSNPELNIFQLVRGNNPLPTELLEKEKNLRRAQTENEFLGHVPRFYTEAAAYILFAILLTLSFFLVSDSLFNAANLTILAFGGQKLLPLSQQIYRGWAMYSGNKKCLLDILKITEKNKNNQIIISKVDHKKHNLNTIRFLFKKNKGFKNDLDINLKRNEWLALVGPSGAGKTTTLQNLLYMGSENNIDIFLNNKLVSKKERINYWSEISYVSQYINLGNFSILKNITGKDKLSDIDKNRLEKSLKVCLLDDFIRKKSIYSEIRENHEDISGGEAQRIAIARGLYQEPAIIFFDEITSAIDIKNEKKLLENIRNYYPNLIVVMAAHRENSIKSCNFILNLNNLKEVSLEKIT